MNAKALSDTALVLGKLASRVIALLLLIVAGVPILAFLPLFGGVDPGAVVRVTATTLLGVLYAGAHAIYFSATTATLVGALMRTYWWLAVWLLGVPAAFMIPINAFGLTSNPGYWTGVLGIGFLVNPIGPFLVASDGFAYQGLVNSAGPGFFPLGFVLPAAWSFLLIWSAIRQVRQTPVCLAWRLNRIPRLNQFLIRLRADFDALIGPIRRRPALLLFPVENPLWWRARQTHAYDRAGFIGTFQGGKLLCPPSP
jgi:hypothetical protein